MQSLIRSRKAKPEELPSLSFGHSSLAHILSNHISEDLRTPAERQRYLLPQEESYPASSNLLAEHSSKSYKAKPISELY